MVVIVSPDKAIRDVQTDFTGIYPFLKLEFYKLKNSDPTLPVRKHLSSSTLLKAAGLAKEGEIIVEDTMTVKQLEKIFLKEFGLLAQVSRRSGSLWLETTMTDSWTLQKQNEHGREISLTPAIYPMNEPVNEQFVNGGDATRTLPIS